MLNPQKLPPEEEFFLKQWANKSREEQEECALQLLRINRSLTLTAVRQDRMLQERNDLLEALKRLKDTPRKTPLVLPDLGEK